MGEALLMNHKRKKKPEGLKYYDTLTTIGASETLDGATYNKAGYFGTVPASELFTGTELASLVGITQGVVQHDGDTWLKFYLDGKILFRPMKAFRNRISWDTLNSAQCVFGEKKVSKNGVSFKVRLMKATPSGNFNGATIQAQKSEWNRLILPLHEKAMNGGWGYPQSVELDLPNWGTNFTDVDLITITTAGNGSAIWCQEADERNITDKVIRGRNGAEFIGSITSSSSIALVGWCPILEVIPPEELEGGI